MSARAQEPAPPTLQPAQDTAAAQDTAVVQDTTLVDTLPPLPTFPLFTPAAVRPPALAAEWGLPDLLATGALTFADLLEFSPFMQAIRVGFLEGPQAEVFSGAGAVSLRYQVDGYEVAPIEGGPLDLHLLSLIELQRLRLARAPGGFFLSSDSYSSGSRDAYSRIEAGTGDQDTNVIRGFFHSRFLGGPFGFGFDRVDTDGSRELGSAERTVIWARLGRPLPGGLWGQIEFRSSSSERDSFPAPDRSDLIGRLRRPIGTSWYVDAVGGLARVKRSPVSPAGIGEGLAEEERDFEAAQVALRAGHAGEWLRLLSSVRYWDGDGVPKLETEGSLDLTAGFIDLHLSGRWADWDEFQALAGYGALRLRLPLGLRLVGEVEDGSRGLFGGVPLAREFFTRLTGGAELHLGRWRLGGRGGRWRVEPSPTLGAPFDSAGAPQRGGTLSVVEGWAMIPLFRLFGGQLESGFRYGAREEGPVFYWPKEWWRLEGLYHVEAVGGQLEVWLRSMGGVRGTLLAPDDFTVPAGLVSTGDLNWFRAEAVVRVLSVHVYYNYEFFDSLTILGELPGFELPRARYHFGVKWEFWN